MKTFSTTKYYALLILLFCYGKNLGQNSFSIPLKIGYGINAPININDNEVKNANGFVLQFGVEYEFKLFKKLYAETGLAGRAIFASGKIQGSSYIAQTLRARLPLKIGWILSDKWKVASGIVIQNNKDFITIDLREEYFWRQNLIVEGKYSWKKKWYWIADVNYELRDLPNAFFINDPKLIVTVGVGRKF